MLRTDKRVRRHSVPNHTHAIFWLYQQLLSRRLDTRTSSPSAPRAAAIIPRLLQHGHSPHHCGKPIKSQLQIRPLSQAVIAQRKTSNTWSATIKKPLAPPVHGQIFKGMHAGAPDSHRSTTSRFFQLQPCR